MFLRRAWRSGLLAVRPFPEESPEKEKADFTAQTGTSGPAKAEISESCLHCPYDSSRSDGIPARNQPLGRLFKVHRP